MTNKWNENNRFHFYYQFDPWPVEIYKWFFFQDSAKKSPAKKKDPSESDPDVIELDDEDEEIDDVEEAEEVIKIEYFYNVSINRKMSLFFFKMTWRFSARKMNILFGYC